MPFLLLALPLLLVLLVVVLMPISLVQRYRMGTTRRMARSWLATINVVAMALSTGIFMTAAALTSVWVPNAFSHAALGLASGVALGVFGLWLSRWEDRGGSLHYTPNRWLVLALTTAVAARVLYGFWRGWHSWRTPGADGSWLAAAGVAGSLGVGAVVLGYYLTYWIGVGRRARRHRDRAMPAGRR